MRYEGERTFEVVIPLKVRVTAAGFFDPGCRCSRPEDCYPPEGECLIDRVQVYCVQSQDGDIAVCDLGSDCIEAIETAFDEELQQRQDDD